MSIRAIFLSGLAAFMMGLPSFLTAGEHRLGGGAHYWAAVEDVDVEDVEEDGFSWLLSYQYRPGDLFSINVELEVFPDEFAGLDESAISPQVYALIGKGLYAGVGVGTYYVDGNFEENFFNIRAGLEVELLSNLYLDMNLNYMLMEWGDLNDELDKVDTDTITLGAAIRVAL